MVQQTPPEPLHRRPQEAHGDHLHRKDKPPPLRSAHQAAFLWSCCVEDADKVSRTIRSTGELTEMFFPRVWRYVYNVECFRYHHAEESAPGEAYDQIVSSPTFGSISPHFLRSSFCRPSTKSLTSGTRRQQRQPNRWLSPKPCGYSRHLRYRVLTMFLQTSCIPTIPRSAGTSSTSPRSIGAL